MELNFTFDGIALGGGKYPRAKVTASVPDDDMPAHLAVASIVINLPIAHLDAPTSEVAAQALQTARRLVNEQVLAEWVRRQPLPPEQAPPR